MQCANRYQHAEASNSFLKMRVPTGISMQCCMNCESYRHQHAMLICVADLYVYDSLQYDRRVFAWTKKLSVATNDKK